MPTNTRPEDGAARKGGRKRQRGGQARRL